MSDWIVALLLLLMWCYGFVTAWAICHDGKSRFWTAYMDVTSLRILWR